MACRRNWSDLPIELLQIVCKKKLIVIKDLAVFGDICSHWRRALILFHKHIPPQQLPLLMYPNYVEHAAFSLPDFQKHLFSSKQSRTAHRGCTHGWIISMVPDMDTLQLYNPFSSVNILIKLPYPRFEEDVPKHVSKAILLDDPSKTSNYRLMAIYDLKLFLFRPANTSWTRLDFVEQKVHENLLDIAYYEDHLYGISLETDSLCMKHCYLVSCNTNSSPLSLKRVAQLSIVSNLVYLVVSAGELLCVKWENARNLIDTRFRVFKFETRKQYEMVELDNLRGHAIFLALNSSGISVQASDFPDCCKPDHIYFASDHNRNVVFNFIDKTVEIFEMSDFNYRGPMWIQPRLNLLTNTTTTKEFPCSSRVHP